MEGGHQGDSLEVVEPAAQVAERFWTVQQFLADERPHGADDCRGDGLDLPEQKRVACLNGRRIRGGFGKALGEQGEIDLAAVQTDGGQHLVQQLAGCPAEGGGRGVILPAWPIADDHQADPGVALAENRAGAACMSGAALAVLQFGSQVGKGRGRRRWRRGNGGRLSGGKAVVGCPVLGGRDRHCRTWLRGFEEAGQFVGARVFLQPQFLLHADDFSGVAQEIFYRLAACRIGHWKVLIDLLIGFAANPPPLSRIS